MLTVDRRQSIHRHFRATRDRQVYRARLVENQEKTSHPERTAQGFSVTTGPRILRYAGRVIKKCSLAVVGGVSAATSRIQVQRKNIFKVLKAIKAVNKTIEIFDYAYTRSGCNFDDLNFMKEDKKIIGFLYTLSEFSLHMVMKKYSKEDIIAVFLMS